MPKSKTAPPPPPPPPLSDFKKWRKLLRDQYEAANVRAAPKDKDKDKGPAPVQGKAKEIAESDQSRIEPVRPREVAQNVMKLAAYRYYRQLADADLMDALRAWVEKRDRHQWQGHGEGEELWVLRLIAARGEQKMKQSAAESARVRKKRSRLAAEFKLAALNDIRPEALLGFLFEAGPIKLIEEDAKNAVRYPWAEAYR